MKKIRLFLFVLISLFIFYSCSGPDNKTLEDIKNEIILRSFYSEDFILPKSFDDVIVSWEENSDYLEIKDGMCIITRQEKDVMVTLKCVINYNNEKDEKIFNITILKKDKSPLNDLTISETSKIKSDFLLPKSKNGYEIKWFSSNENLIEIVENENDITAKVKKAKFLSDDSIVVLTAKCPSYNEDQEKKFTVSVDALDFTIEIDNIKSNYIVGEKALLNVITTRYKPSELSYSFDKDGIVAIENEEIIALNEGSVKVSVKISNEEVYSFNVNVINNEEIIRINLHETKKVPFINDEDLIFKSLNNDIFSITNDGMITGIKEGEGTLLISSLSSTFKKIIKIIVEDEKVLECHFVNVGQADCIIVLLPNDEVMMIDAGYSSTGDVNKAQALKNLNDKLDELDIDYIDYFFISHNHQDHFAFIPDILDRCEVINLFGSGSKRTNPQYLEIMQSIKDHNIDYQVVRTGDVMLDEEGIFIQVVATREAKDDKTPNTTSVIVRLKYKNISFLFTGDAGNTTSSDTEKLLMSSNYDIESDILKVAHHGSDSSTSNEFLERVKPKVAILTTASQSRDNLPSENTLSRIRNKNITIYQTKDNGNITVYTNGEEFNVETQK